MMIRLFEKTSAGLLLEIDPERAADAKAGRRVSRVTGAEYDVLWTEEEEAARDAEEAEQRIRKEAAHASQVETDKRRAAATAKLLALGLTPEDLDVLRNQ